MPTLISLERLKARLRIPAAITEHDVALCDAIDDAEAEILCEASFASFAATTYSEKLDVEWFGCNEVRTTNSFIQSVVALTDCGVALVQGTDYYATDYSYLRLIPDGAYFTEGRQTVDVTYVAGPVVNGVVPSDLRKLTGLIAARDFNMTPKSGLESEKIGRYAYKMGGSGGVVGTAGGAVAMDPTEREIDKLMSRYRRAFAQT